MRTHHILTGVGRDDGRFVLIYEDVRVDPELPEPSRVYAWPLYVHGADGTPCTIVAELLSGDDAAHSRAVKPTLTT